MPKPEFNLTKKLNIVSGYVSIETDRTPSPKNGHAKRRSKCFAKFAKVTSTPAYGYIPNSSSLILLFEQSGCQIDIVCGDLLNAERRQNGISI